MWAEKKKSQLKQLHTHTLDNTKYISQESPLKTKCTIIKTTTTTTTDLIQTFCTKHTM